jgi:hypothetical protein
MCPESDPSECLFEVRRGLSATREFEDLEVGGMCFEFFAHGLDWLSVCLPISRIGKGTTTTQGVATD